MFWTDSMVDAEVLHAKTANHIERKETWQVMIALVKTVANKTQQERDSGRGALPLSGGFRLVISRSPTRHVANVIEAKHLWRRA